MDTTKEQEITLLYQLIEKHFGSGVLMQFEDLTETDNDQLLNRIETMTTYNSYQEAKIAMPNACICVFKNEGKDAFFGMSTREGTTLHNGSKFAEPQDYCMTVDKFLYDGHEFVEGDVYLNSDGRTLGVVNIPEYNNKRSTIDCDLYILRAAALETKEPKRTKVEYVNVHNSEAIKAVMEGSIDYWCEISGSYSNLTMDSSLQEFCCAVHRIETPIEWWEDANDLLGELANLSLDDDGVLQLTMGKGQVGFGMSRDKWCDFARILLEQGE